MGIAQTPMNNVRELDEMFLCQEKPLLETLIYSSALMRRQ